MSRPGRTPGRRRPDPDAAALVRRTLQDVAAALTVADEPARPLGPLGRSTADGTTKGGDAGERLRAGAGQGAGHRPDQGPHGQPAAGGALPFRDDSGPRRHRLLVAAVMCLVAGLAATAVWAARPATESRPATAPDGEGTAGGGVATDEGYPIPTWLPAGFDRSGPDMLDDSGGADPPVEATLASAPGAADALILLEVPDSTIESAWSAAEHVGRVLGVDQLPGGEYAIASVQGESSARAVLVRGDANALRDAAVDLATEPVAPGAEIVPAGWEAGAVDIAWVPRLGSSRMASYQRYEGESLEGIISLGAVSATLPAAEGMAALLDGESPTPIRGLDGWEFPVTIGDRPGTAVVWQESPGVVGYVEGLGVDPMDVERIAEDATWPVEVVPDVPTGGDEAGADEAGGAEAATSDHTMATPSGEPAGPQPLGDPAVPCDLAEPPTVEEAGHVATGDGTLPFVATDTPFEASAWAEAVERPDGGAVASCWFVRTADGTQASGGSDVARTRRDPVLTVAALAWSDDEALLVADHPPHTSFTTEDGPVPSEAVPVALADGSLVSFLRVPRGAGTVQLTVVGPAGGAVAIIPPVPTTPPG